MLQGSLETLGCVHERFWESLPRPFPITGPPVGDPGSLWPPSGLPLRPALGGAGALGSGMGLPGLLDPVWATVTGLTAPSGGRQSPQYVSMAMSWPLVCLLLIQATA